MSALNPFMNDGYLDISASLNKVNMVKIPGLDWSVQLAGKTAHEVLSSRAVAGVVKEYFPEAAPLDYGQTLQLLHERLSGNCEQSCQQARKVCSVVARNMFCLILLLTGQNINRSAARLDWSNEQWKWWGTIGRVVLGGGLLAGAVGAEVKKHIDHLWFSFGINKPVVELSSCAEYMPLAGAANILRRTAADGCILDFGHTSCKRALVLADGSLQMFPKTGIGPSVSYGEGSYNAGLAQALDEKVTEIVCDTIEVARDVSCTNNCVNMVISIANYYDGHMFATRGGYAKLNLVSRNYRRHLCNKVMQRTGLSLNVDFVHDCTAAAAAVTENPEQRTAVIVMGTGLGAGFC